MKPSWPCGINSDELWQNKDPWLSMSRDIYIYIIWDILELPPTQDSSYQKDYSMFNRKSCKLSFVTGILGGG